ncbi:MAG TPA: DoxX family protein [Candidatus Tumulicola sp.]|nr:DoxX family protein [Candidatus Tumulicola sp.]
MSTLMVLFLLFDATIHIMRPPAVVEAFAKLGFPQSAAIGLGITELVCIALYVIPRTSVLGAILLTGYLGGAIATQLRSDQPLFSLVFPVLIAVLIWGGIFLRDERLRALIPLRK